MDGTERGNKNTIIATNILMKVFMKKKIIKHKYYYCVQHYSRV